MEYITLRLDSTNEVEQWYVRRNYSKTCLKRTPYIPETWTNGK